MPSTLRTVESDFFVTAPHSFVSREPVNQSPEAVWTAVAEDPAGWGDWFPGFSKTGRYTTPGPHGVGSVREVRMGGISYREDIIEWEAPNLWSFYVEQTTLPVANAFAERYRITADGNGSLVEWTLALEPKGAFRYMTPVMAELLPVMFRQAMRRLDRKLGSSR